VKATPSSGIAALALTPMGKENKITDRALHISYAGDYGYQAYIIILYCHQIPSVNPLRIEKI
jgi:hypothetical protein